MPQPPGSNCSEIPNPNTVKANRSTKRLDSSSSYQAEAEDRPKLGERVASLCEGSPPDAAREIRGERSRREFGAGGGAECEF